MIFHNLRQQTLTASASQLWIYFITVQVLLLHYSSSVNSLSPFTYNRQSCYISNNNVHQQQTLIKTSINNSNFHGGLKLRKTIPISSYVSLSSSNNDENELKNNENEFDNYETPPPPTTTEPEKGSTSLPTKPPPSLFKQQQQQPSSALTPAIFMKAMNTSPRRIFLSFLASTFIALVSNFLGVTSNVLQSLPESIVEKSKVDLIYPRGNYKRFQSSSGSNWAYSILLPKEWVADTALELAKVQRRTGSLDYSMKRPTSSSDSIPDAAFGPPGKFNERGVSNSDTNVSILVSNISTTKDDENNNFTLRNFLGTPTDAAQKLLKLSITTPDQTSGNGNGRIATLINAIEEERNNDIVYQFEYKVEQGTRSTIRAISVIVVTGGSTNIGGSNKNLITMTVVAPEKYWLASNTKDNDESYGKKLRTIAESFKLIR